MEELVNMIRWDACIPSAPAEVALPHALNWPQARRVTTAMKCADRSALTTRRLRPLSAVADTCAPHVIVLWNSACTGSRARRDRQR